MNEPNPNPVAMRHAVEKELAAKWPACQPTGKKPETDEDGEKLPTWSVIVDYDPAGSSVLSGHSLAEAFDKAIYYAKYTPHPDGKAVKRVAIIRETRHSNPVAETDEAKAKGRLTVVAGGEEKAEDQIQVLDGMSDLWEFLVKERGYSGKDAARVMEDVIAWRMKGETE